jgi:glycosyltransferase involved in cell wall biosynthesis
MMTPARPSLAFFLPSLAGGGAERAMVNLAAGFSQRGVQTDFVLANATGPYLGLLPPAVRVVDLKASSVLRSLAPLVAYLRRERPRTLLSALDHASLAAMTASRMSFPRTRTVISVQSTFEKGIRPLSDLRTSAVPWLLGRLHRWADAIVAVSAGVAEDIATTTGIPRGRVDVIYNPVITPGLLRAASERPAHPWFEDDSRATVLGVGRLAPQKNFPLLIEAFARVNREHDARLVILGEGPERSNLEALVRRHGLETRVALPGFVTNPFACMARASVFVLSSDFEGLPTVLIESLAVGTPVVATDCPSGPREILRGGSLGRLVPVADVEALARAIQCTLVSPLPTPSAEALHPYTLDSVVDQFRKACGLDA